MGHILVVEDEETIRDLIIMNLTMVGHTSISAADGAEAMNAIASSSFDLCLLDVMHLLDNQAPGYFAGRCKGHGSR
jgi:DNA-binding response OmpR family regulator